MPVTLQKLQEQGIERLFGHEMLYYVYHKMNGREQEAQSYFVFTLFLWAKSFRIDKLEVVSYR